MSGHGTGTPMFPTGHENIQEPLDGGGVGLPVHPSMPEEWAIQEPLPYTSLSIYEWASKLGLNPVHFAGGYVPGKYIDQPVCDTPWSRYAWQSWGHISHIDVARAIERAESLIEDYLGYHVAPKWRTDTYEYPRYKRLHRTNAIDRSGRRPAIQMDRGYVIDVGVRRQDELATASVNYIDSDGDGWPETAVVSIITDVDIKELVVYPRGFTHHPSWAIRWPRFQSETGNTKTFYFDFWLMVDPRVYSSKTGSHPEKFDFSDPGILLAEVDICRLWNDNSISAGPVTAYWEPTPGHESAGERVAKTIGIVRDNTTGMVAPMFPEGLGCGGSPDRVSVSYYSGLVSDNYKSGYTVDPIHTAYRDAVFYLATARLTRDVCSCNEAHVLADELRSDMAVVSPKGNFLTIAESVQTSPFGTRRGEWLAWKEIQSADKHIEVALV